MGGQFGGGGGGQKGNIFIEIRRSGGTFPGQAVFSARLWVAFWKKPPFFPFLAPRGQGAETETVPFYETGGRRLRWGQAFFDMAPAENFVENPRPLDVFGAPRGERFEAQGLVHCFFFVSENGGEEPAARIALRNQQHGRSPAREGRGFFLRTQPIFIG